MDDPVTIKKQLDLLFAEKSTEELADLADQTAATMTYYRCAMMEIETKFRVLNEQFSLSHERNPIESISTRLKTISSIREKLLRKEIPISLEAMKRKIFDIAGVRVICAFQDDIYLLADCLLQQDDVKLLARKDYIRNPKDNGYRSLHLIVEIPIFLQNEKRMIPVEVQLRTIAMESWANLEHRLRYKKNVSPALQEQISQELAECARFSEELDARMQHIRNVLDHHN